MAEPVLRKGSTDPAVRDLQQALRRWATIPDQSMVRLATQPKRP